MMSVASSTTPGIDWNSCSTPLDLHRCNGRAFDRRQHYAPQRVANGGAEAALKRLSPEDAVLVG